jgi:DNA-binding XRE family transcriptional regulator
MRRKIKIPRVIKLNWVKELTVSIVFNNGESRIVDFQKVFKSLKINKDSPISVLYDPDEFSKVEIQNNTLSWSNVEQFITLKNKDKLKVPFEIGADTLLKFSVPEKQELEKRIGRLIRESRLKSGLTQQELAIMSGTTRNYISRIENDRTDFELATLKKIVETGLGKQLEIVIK